MRQIKTFLGYKELVDVFLKAGANVTPHLLHTKLTPLHLVAYQGMHIGELKYSSITTNSSNICKL